MLGHTMLLSGLVLAGANRQDRRADSDRSILTAEAVGGMDLLGTELVTLSACETGLGNAAGGEGVLGLQRAFHVAGARSVLTSLWRIDDAATGVLMEEFYTNLWVRRLPKLEALRRAQLAVYRNPTRVRAGGNELASRGIKVGRTRQLLNDGDAAGASHPRLWAAFVMSGRP